MENIDIKTPEIVVESPKQKNKMSIIGFTLFLAGPAILVLANILMTEYGYFPQIVARIITWGAILLPGAGVIICFFQLCRWRKTGKLGRALSIVTVIMCNPIVYIYYCLYAVLYGSTMAGLPWM
ncbi:MAG: hypothetical protein LBC96_09830 [Lachnospiraceae bacterium]|nr:hypothetical protein [Lachnospiraceae bacterium]